MSAHAVGHGPESAFGLLEAGILVDLADHAGMRSGGRGPPNGAGFDAHARGEACWALHGRCQWASLLLCHQPSLKFTAF
jgi:hypothetical protein